MNEVVQLLKLLLEQLTGANMLHYLWNAISDSEHGQEKWFALKRTIKQLNDLLEEQYPSAPQGNALSRLIASTYWQKAEIYIHRHIYPSSGGTGYSFQIITANRWFVGDRHFSSKKEALVAARQMVSHWIVCKEHEGYADLDEMREWYNKWEEAEALVDEHERERRAEARMNWLASGGHREDAHEYVDTVVNVVHTELDPAFYRFMYPRVIGYSPVPPLDDEVIPF